MPNALRIICSEHRSIEAVLHGLSFFVDEIWAGRPGPNPDVFRAMLQYIDLFAERLHHPKEDRHLFQRLRARTREADRLLAYVDYDHGGSAERIRKLEQAFLRYEEGGVTHFLGYAQAVKSYVSFHREHVHLEETKIFPIASRVLTAEDWREIDMAFDGRGDAAVSPQTERDMANLFTRIVSIAPAPIGVAPESAVVY